MTEYFLITRLRHSDPTFLFIHFTIYHVSGIDGFRSLYHKLKPEIISPTFGDNFVGLLVIIPIYYIFSHYAIAQPLSETSSLPRLHYKHEIRSLLVYRISLALEITTTLKTLGEFAVE